MWLHRVNFIHVEVRKDGVNIQNELSSDQSAAAPMEQHQERQRSDDDSQWLVSVLLVEAAGEPQRICPLVKGCSLRSALRYFGLWFVVASRPSLWPPAGSKLVRDTWSQSFGACDGLSPEDVEDNHGRASLLHSSNLSGGSEVTARWPRRYTGLALQFDPIRIWFRCSRDARPALIGSPISS